MSFFTDVRKTINYFGRNGFRETVFAAAERLRENRTERYAYVGPSEEELSLQRKEYEALREGSSPVPVISFLVPVYEPDPEYLRQMIVSVLSQTYQNFELVLADASAGDVGRKIAESFHSEKISWHALAGNGGISANTNAAADFAQGDYVALLDYDDMIALDCVREMTRAILERQPEILYSDEDKCSEKADRYFEPNRKPDFNADYFLANNYICHLLVMKRELFLALKLRSAFDGAQDYDLMLRAPWSNIWHVPKVLYHWRTHPGSTAGNPASKDYAYEAGLLALKDYFARTHINAEVTHSRHRGFYTVTYRPDIFTARKDVGIVGGMVIGRGDRITGGLMDKEGNVLFLGKSAMESGPMHRMDTMQDADAVDVRCMQIREELKSAYAAVFNASYDSHVMRRNEDGLKVKSVELCGIAKSMGYLVVYDPRMSVKTG